MSTTLSLSGDTSILSFDYFPPIELSGDYECGLVDLLTYNSIPNIDIANNLFHIGDQIIEIPIGSYEFDDITEYLKKQLQDRFKNNEINSEIVLLLSANNNTLKSMLFSNEIVYFNKERSIGNLFGFSKQELKSNIMHTSDLPVNITKVNAIRVECDIIAGSFNNTMPSHILHEFSPMTEPGYKIVEIPKNVIYLPVNVKTIRSLTLKLVDQDGDIINFRGEKITIRLHLRPQHAGV